MNYKQRLFKTSLWLGGSLILLLVAVIFASFGEDEVPIASLLLSIDCLFIIYPAIFEIYNEIYKLIKKDQQQKTQAPLSLADNPNRRADSSEKSGLERFFGIAIPILAGLLIVTFLKIYAAIGFTIYRVAVLIYCIVKIAKEPKQQPAPAAASAPAAGSSAASSFDKHFASYHASSMSHSLRDPSFTADYENDYSLSMFTRSRTIFKDKEFQNRLRAYGINVPISSEDMMLFDSPSHPGFDAEWDLRMSTYSITVLRQGLDYVLGEDSLCTQVLYVTKVMEDCPQLNKRRGDVALFLLSYTHPGENQRFHLMLLEHEADDIAYDYLLENAPDYDFHPVYSKGKYPLLLRDAQGNFFSVQPLRTAEYEGKEYLLVRFYEEVPNISPDTTFLMSVEKDENDLITSLIVVQDAALANTIFNACFADRS